MTQEPEVKIDNVEQRRCFHFLEVTVNQYRELWTTQYRTRREAREAAHQLPVGDKWTIIKFVEVKEKS